MAYNLSEITADGKLSQLHIYVNNIAWADLLNLPGIPDEGCKAGQVFKNECNTCECTKDGILKCSKVACGSPLSESKLMARESRAADIPKEDCIPGILYKKGCQKCFCNHNLTISCLTDTDRCQIEDEAWADLLSLSDIPGDGTCTAGQIYKNDCNTCECSMNGILKCSMVACRAPSDELKSGVARSGSELRANLPKGDCIPGKMYKKGCQRCFCDYYHKLSCFMDKEGCNIKNEAKQDTLLRVHPAFKNQNITGLPKMPQQAYKCEPGMMYSVDCNKCLCFSDHNLHCSKMLCLSHDDKHRNLAKKLSGISCKTISKIKNPCIKCRCKNNATVCDAITGCVSGEENKILQLKGAQLDPKKLSIDAGEDKCIPKSVYRDNCNSCYCQAEKILRCTQKTCLKYTHVVALEKQRLYLEKHGL